MKWVNKNPRLSIVVFGFVSGMLGGLANGMSPILIIYSLESKHTKKS